MKKLIFMLGLLFAITACSAVTSSGVQLIDKDRYTVTANMKGVKINGEENSALTRSKAMDDANTFCRKKGYRYANVSKEFIERSERATATLYFRCVKKS